MLYILIYSKFKKDNLIKSFILFGGLDIKWGKLVMIEKYKINIIPPITSCLGLIIGVVECLSLYPGINFNSTYGMKTIIYIVLYIFTLLIFNPLMQVICFFQKSKIKFHKFNFTLRIVISSINIIYFITVLFVRPILTHSFILDIHKFDPTIISLIFSTTICNIFLLISNIIFVCLDIISRKYHTIFS